MKILILSTIRGCDWAGTEEVWFQFAKHALQAGHQVMVAADWQIALSSQVEELKLKGLIVSSRKVQRPMRLYLLKQKYIPDHADAIRFQPDICLINAGSPLDLEYNPHLKVFLQHLSCKKVFFCHFNSDRLRFNNRDQVAETFKSMSAVIFVNQENKNQLEVQLARKLSNAHVILNASRLSLSRPLPYPSMDQIYFANVARLDTFWKGQDLLPQVFSSAEWSDRNCSMELFGTGADRDYIESLIYLFQATQKVRLIGYERSVEKIWLHRHMLILPSRGEGTPLAAIEAMMCGRPVVATAVGGNEEVIEDGVTGFIAEAPTRKSLTSTMERAWKCKDMWKEMGERAHAKAVELVKRSPEAMLLNTLQEIAENAYSK